MPTVRIPYRMGIIKPDPVVALSTTFAAIGVISLDKGAAIFTGRLEGVWVKVDTIAGGAAKLTVRLCSDANGDECILTDTVVDLSAGKSTATKGTAVIKIALGWVNGVDGGGDSVYTFIKTDAGTANCNEVRITWRE